MPEPVHANVWLATVEPTAEITKLHVSDLKTMQCLITKFSSTIIIFIQIENFIIALLISYSSCFFKFMQVKCVK